MARQIAQLLIALLTFGTPLAADQNDPFCPVAADLSRLNSAHAQITFARSVDYTRAGHRHLAQILTRVNSSAVIFYLGKEIGSYDMTRLITLVEEAKHLHKVGQLNGVDMLLNYRAVRDSKVDHAEVSGIIDALDCNVPIYMASFNFSSGNVSKDSGEREDIPQTREEVDGVILWGAIGAATLALVGSIAAILKIRHNQLAAKVQILQQASMVCDGETHAALALTMSRKMVELRHTLPAKPRQGTAIQIRIGDLTLNGSAHSATDRSLSLALDEHLEAEILERLSTLPKTEPEEFEADIQKAALAKLVPPSILQTG